MSTIFAIWNNRIIRITFYTSVDARARSFIENNWLWYAITRYENMCTSSFCYKRWRSKDSFDDAAAASVETILFSSVWKFGKQILTVFRTIILSVLYFSLSLLRLVKLTISKLVQNIFSDIISWCNNTEWTVEICFK